MDENNNWVMDITHYPEYVAFCPYEDNGNIVLGMTYIADKCPGVIVGVMHLDSPEMSDKFIEEHPHLRAEFEKRIYFFEAKEGLKDFGESMEFEVAQATEDLIDQITPDNINIDRDWEKLT